MVFFLQQVSLSATPEGTLPYRYLEADMSAPPVKTDCPCIRLSFSEPATFKSLSAFTLTPNGRDEEWLQTRQYPAAKAFSIWIPEAYPPLSSLRVKITADRGQPGIWTITGLPEKEVNPPPLKESQNLEPGVTVSGKARSEGWQWMSNLVAKLPDDYSDWYWEAATQSPYSPDIDKADLQDWLC